MKNSANSKRTPYLSFLVMVVLMLICIAGLAMDGGNGIDGPGRHLQNAADTAALGAALCHVRGKAPIPCAYDMAAQNGYNNDMVSNQVEAYTCDMVQARCGSYAGKPNYIQVIITTYAETFLTKLVGIRLRERSAQAIGFAQQQPPQTRLLYEYSDNKTARSWVCSTPPWIQFILEPYRLVFLFLIGAIILGLLLLRHKHVKPA